MGTYFSVEISIVFILMAAAVWGSWMQVTKHLDGYPISGIIFLTYGSSFTFIWSVTLTVSSYLPEMRILEMILKNRATVLRILYGGGLMSPELYFSLTITGEVGLLLSTTINGGVGTVLGLLTSISEEGLPDGKYDLSLVVLTAVILLMADLIYNLTAEKWDQGLYHVKKRKSAMTGRVLALMLPTAIFASGWSAGMAVGTVRGFTPVLTCAYVVTGSFLSVGTLPNIKFTVRREWKKVLCIGTGKKPILLSAIAVVCHYDGNLISIRSMPAISATLSFLSGKSANVWTIFWGICCKEFAGISGKAERLLQTGTLLYFVGTGFLGIYQLARKHEIKETGRRVFTISLVGVPLLTSRICIIYPSRAARNSAAISAGWVAQL